MKSIDTTRFGLIVARKGVKATRFFTRSERIRMIQADHEARQKKLAGMDVLAAARAEIAADKAEKAKGAARRLAMLSNPDKKIKEGKDGTLFYQERTNGRFGPRVVVG